MQSLGNQTLRNWSSYESVVSVLVDCAANDDCVGARRINVQHGTGCSVLSICDHIGWGLLHHAVYHRSFRMVRFLIENGISVNDRVESSSRNRDMMSNECQATALHLAAAAHSYDMINVLVDLGAIVTLSASGSNLYPLQFLLRSASLNKKKAAMAVTNPVECVRAIEALLPSFDALWEIDVTGLPLFAHLLSALPANSAALLEGVWRLLSQVPDSSRNCQVLVDSLCHLFSKKKHLASVFLLQKYREYLIANLEPTHRTLSADAERRLFRDAVLGGVLQVFAAVCNVIDPKKMLPEDLKALVLDCICRKDALMLKSILDQTCGSSSLVDELYDLTSLAPHQSPITVALFTGSIDLMKSVIVASSGKITTDKLHLFCGQVLPYVTAVGSYDSLTFIRGLVGNIAFYRSMFQLLQNREDFDATGSMAIVPLTILGEQVVVQKRLFETFCKKSHLKHLKESKCNELRILQYFLDVEMLIYQSEKMHLVLPSVEIPVLRPGHCTFYMSPIAQLEASVEAQTKSYEGSNVITQIPKAAMSHICHYLSCWENLSEGIVHGTFVPNMRMLLRCRPSKLLNGLAEALFLLSGNKDASCRLGQSLWSSYISQLRGSTVVVRISKIRELLLKYGPNVSYDKATCSAFMKPHFDKTTWQRLKVLSANFDLSLEKSLGPRGSAAAQTLCTWVKTVVFHDDYFYDVNVDIKCASGEQDLSDNVKAKVNDAAIAFAFVALDRIRLLKHYCTRFEHSQRSAYVPYNCLSIALVALCQQLELDDRITSWMDEFAPPLGDDIMYCHTKESSFRSSSASSSRIVHVTEGLDDYITRLLEYVFGFYFGDVDMQVSSNQKHTFDAHCKEKIFLILCRLLLPLSFRRLWAAAACLLQKLIQIYDSSTINISRSTISILFTDLHCGDLLSYQTGCHFASTRSNFIRDALNRPDQLRCVSPIDFALEDRNFEFYKSYLSLFPECRREFDVCTALMSRAPMIKDSDFSFLLSGCCLDVTSNKKDGFVHITPFIRKELEAAAKRCDLRVNHELNREFSTPIQGDKLIFLKPLASVDVDFYNGTVYSCRSLAGFCEIDDGKILLTDGSKLEATEIGLNIINYIFRLPAPLLAKGNGTGYCLLHALFDGSVSTVVTDMLFSWAIRTKVHFSYLLVDNEGKTPIFFMLENQRYVSHRFLSSIDQCIGKKYNLVDHTVSSALELNLRKIFRDRSSMLSVSARHKVAVISNSLTQRESLLVLLQKSILKCSELWGLIEAQDFRQLFSVMYSVNMCNLDSIVRVKRIMSLLNIPCSKIGVGSIEELEGNHGEHRLPFMHPSPKDVAKFVNLDVAREIKKMVMDWIAMRLPQDTEQISIESLMLFYRYTSGGVLSLGLFGSNAPKLLDVFSDIDYYKNQLHANRHEMQSLSTQVASETKLTSHFNSKLSAQVSPVGLNDHSRSAESLQITLKLAYLLLDFFGHLVRVRELIAITNTNGCDITEGGHPLDISLSDIRDAESHEKLTASICDRLVIIGGDVDGRVKNRGVSTKFMSEFFHSITRSDFSEFFTLLIIDHFSSDIKSVGDYIISSFICILRLIGEYTLSEAIVSILGSTNDGIPSAAATRIFESVFDFFQSITIQMIVEATEKADSFCLTAVAHLHENKDHLLSWVEIDKHFFTSKQRQVGKAEEEKLAISVRLLKVLQSTGSIIIHTSGVIKMKSIYTVTDAQVSIWKNFYNPLCTLCLSEVAKESGVKICNYLIMQGVDFIVPDRNGCVAFVSSVLHAKVHILDLFLHHIYTAPDFAWRTTSSSRVVSFSEAYFEKYSPFRFLVWHILMLCPCKPITNTIDSDRIDLLRAYYEECLIRLTSFTDAHGNPQMQRIIFPLDAPQDVCFSCLELAALKQLPILCTSWVNSLISRRSGFQASSFLEDRMISSPVASLKVFVFSLLSQVVPVSTWKLLLSCLPQVPNSVPFDEIWPLSSEIRKAARIHHDFVYRYFENKISEDSICKGLNDAFCNLARTTSRSFHSSIVDDPNTSMSTTWNLLILALGTREPQKVVVIARELALSEGEKHPSSLLHLAVYYDMVLPILDAVDKDGRPLICRENVDQKTYFTPFRREMSALMVAVNSGKSSDTIQALLRAGARVVWTDFVWACRRSSPSISLLLFQSLRTSMSTIDLTVALNQSNSESCGQTILSILCTRGDDSAIMRTLVQTILESGGSVDQVDDIGLSSIQYAIFQGCRKLVQVLLKWKASLGNGPYVEEKNPLVRRASIKLGRLVRCFLLKRFDEGALSDEK